MNRKFTEWSESDYNELEDREPFRTRVYRKGVGIIEMQYSDDDEHMIAFCPKCREYGFSVKLGPKIIMPGETRQPDYENWLQCPSCAEIVAAYVVEGDSSIIKDDIETISNPFENTTEIIGANPRRTTKAGQRALSLSITSSLFSLIVK
jgi:hypothetical protein